MSAPKPSKKAEIPAPNGLDRAGKRLFRQIVRQISQGERPFSDAETDLIADYIAARRRVDLLGSLLAERTRGKAAFQIPENSVMALTRQIDATTTLSHRLAGRLGISRSSGGNE